MSLWVQTGSPTRLSIASLRVTINFQPITQKNIPNAPPIDPKDIKALEKAMAAAS